MSDSTESEILAAAERLEDLLTMLGVNPQERPEHGGESTAETLARAALGPAGARAPAGPEIEAAVRAAYLDHAGITGADPARAATFARVVARRLRAPQPVIDIPTVEVIEMARDIIEFHGGPAPLDEMTAALHPVLPLVDLDFVTEARDYLSGAAGARSEESGQALIASLCPEDGSNEGLFLRLVSWYERGQDAGDPPPGHPQMQRLLGQRLRVELRITKVPEP